MKIRLEIEIDDDTMQILEVLKTTLVPSTFLDGTPLQEEDELQRLGTFTFWNIHDRKDNGEIVGRISLHQAWF